MSHQLGRVVSVILQRYFGENVQKVGDDLFTYGSKPIALLVKSTGLSRIKVVESLRTLLKYDLAMFEPTPNEVIADYRLIPENVLLMIRYPRYLLQIKTKYGSEAEILIEELLQKACSTATVLLVSIAVKYKDDKQASVAELKEGSEIPTLVPVATITPEIDVRAVIKIMNSGNLAESSDNVYWKVNYDRFHQDIRDEIMIKAITRRIDENAGELLRHMLQHMYLTSPAWAAESTLVPAVELREACLRAAADKPLLNQYFDQYLKVLGRKKKSALRVTEESGCGTVRADAGGRGYSVRGAGAARGCLLALLEGLVTERLGYKAARIFRIILDKKYIEEDDVQKNAMLPNKECKELSYKLLEEHFISLQPMRKTASAGGMNKAVYLFHINLHDVAHTVQDMCYKALGNVLRRASHERAAHARLLDKQRRVRSIVHGMRLRAEPQQNIDDVEETLTPSELAVLQGVEKRLKQLSAAELEIDKNLFILKWYFMYTH
ncbi:DNA-directed RNA polymerase III subunit RPC3 isoform X3 [Bombyx mori]|uniref:DNA-directed RNA polymerase III subunit RPC3 isoform X3 n=1 Tax=Bombyx mori TaxID=7091 RepID=UPI002ED66B7C